MATNRDLEILAKIRELEALLQAGETSTTIDGTTSTVDLNVVRSQLADLRRRHSGSRLRRPILSSVDLSRAMR